MRFEYHAVPEWPPLAWLAAVDEGSPTITVFHGLRVETRERWFCEAVWDGDFEDGGFDRTDVVGGTGARLRKDRVVFVPPGSTIDRLNALAVGGRTWISSSLCCLLAAVGGTLDPAYPEYFRDLRTVMYQGLGRHKRSLPTSRGPVELTYFHNLSWDGHAFAIEPKPGDERVWRTFDGYRDFLLSSMEAVAGNLAAPGRAHRYRMLGTLSRGYDSAAVTALASQFGCEDALCFTRSREGFDDNGAPLASYLKVRPHVFESDAWRSLGAIETPFIAGDPGWDEVYLRPAEHLLAGSVFLSGYFGDQMWSKDPRTLEPLFLMGAAGMALTEYRLKVGFIACPPPYWGGRLLRQTAAISSSDAMKPWDVPGPYSRPICRRIVEEAGVPRELFGQRKMMVAVLSQVNEFLNPASYRDYLLWLGEHRGAWTRRRRLPPLPSPGAERLLRQGLNVLWQGSKALGFEALSRRLLFPFHLRRYTYPWAVERTKQLYYPGASATTGAGSAARPAEAVGSQRQPRSRAASASTAGGRIML